MDRSANTDCLFLRVPQKRQTMGLGGGSTNLFTYVDDDPVNGIDPLGECYLGDCAGGGAATNTGGGGGFNDPWLSILILIFSFGFGGGGHAHALPVRDRTGAHIPEWYLIGAPAAVSMADSARRLGCKCIEQVMCVTAYNNLAHRTASGSRPGPGTVAMANTNPYPYHMGSSVTVYNTPGTGGILYQGTIQDTGRGWDYINQKYPNHTRVLPPNDWIDIWLPGKEANDFGVQWKWVRICYGCQQ